MSIFPFATDERYCKPHEIANRRLLFIDLAMALMSIDVSSDDTDIAIKPGGDWFPKPKLFEPVASNDWSERFVRNLRCSYCSKTFYWAEDINDHRPLHCPLCGVAA